MLSSINWPISRWTTFRSNEGPRNDTLDWRWHAYALPTILAAAIGTALSVAAWFVASHQENRQAELEFSSRAKNHALILRNGINQYVDDIDALRTLFEASDHGVSRGEFEFFASRVLQGQTAIRSVAWIPRVKREERSAHEAATLGDGIADYHIRAMAPDGSSTISPERDEYFPVHYRLEKENVGQAGQAYVFGVDQGDDGIRGRTLARARDGNQLSVAEDIKLRSGGGNQRGILILSPVYRKDLPRDTLEDRRANLIGFIRATFQTSTMIETILKTSTTPSGLDLYLFGADVGTAAQPLYVHASRLRTTPIEVRSRTALEAGLHRSYQIDIGDRQLTLIAAPIPGGPGIASHVGAWLALAVGLLLSAVVTAYFWASGRHAQRLQSANGQLDKTLGALSASSNQLLTQNARFDAALNNMVQGLLMFDSSERMVVCNHRYIEMYDLSPDAVEPGISLRELLRRKVAAGHLQCDAEQYRAAFLAELALGKATNQIQETADGREISITNVPMPGGGWVVTHEDVTERRRAEATISHMAMHDSLTDLPNRHFFRNAMESRLAQLDRNEKFAVLCLDLDHFKSVNDTLGHPFGDKLLRQAAERLRDCVREGDVVARLGGDEFAILQGNIVEPNDTVSLMTRLIEVIGQPFDLDGHQVAVGVSVGVALAPSDARNADQLLKNADMALYRAKVDGRSIYRFFQPEMDARMQARRVLELDMRKALVNGEFELYYQPLISLETDMISGFEALIRWNHPERGMVSPVDFIPLAEETALIVPIGEWVLRQACEEATKWPADVRIAVNLSPAQFKTPNLCQTIVSALANSGLAAHRLELEITESVLLFNNEATLATLHQLRAMGVRISMDDFGTGYSSLSYLRSFPFDKIKIDQSFIHDLSTNEDSKAIVRAVTGLGGSLKMATTGEGVETQQELDYLRAEGCTEAQGYFFSKPKPAKEVYALLANQALKGCLKAS